MSVPVGLNLHYRCAFDLVPGGRTSIWSAATAIVQAWIEKKEKVPDLRGSWFSTGGSWRGRGRTSAEVITDQFIGRGSANSPDHWALRYEHPCADTDVRWWRTDIGFTRHSEAVYRVSVTNLHWIVPGYLGEDPASPPTSAPRIVRSLVENAAWEARAGSEVLTNFPKPLRVGDGKAWIERLVDSRRTCPLVYLSAYQDGSPNQLNATRLARLLSGSAVVVTGAESDLDDELRWLLRQEYRCWDGAARVYFPKIDLENRYGGQAHRFFSGTRIDVLGSDSVENMIIVGLARRSLALAGNDVSSIDDVTARRREARFAELREESQDKPSPELLKLFEEENQALVSRNRELEDQARNLASSGDMLELEKEELLAGLEEQRRESKSVQRTCASLNGRIRQLERGLQAFHEIKLLPASLEEVIDLASLVFQDRLYFTDRARKSARAASINQKPLEMPQVWAVLRAMATTLHELHFDQESEGHRDIAKAFESSTPFSLALTETGTTKDNADLMKLRRVEYKETSIDITPHVKYGDSRPPRLLRVYYHPHREEKLLIVGHCGDHLETSGTRRVR